MQRNRSDSDELPRNGLTDDVVGRQQCIAPTAHAWSSKEDECPHLLNSSHWNGEVVEALGVAHCYITFASWSKRVKALSSAKATGSSRLMDESPAFPGRGLVAPTEPGVTKMTILRALGGPMVNAWSRCRYYKPAGVPVWAKSHEESSWNPLKEWNLH